MGRGGEHHELDVKGVKDIQTTVWVKRVKAQNKVLQMTAVGIGGKRGPGPDFRQSESWKHEGGRRKIRPHTSRRLSKGDVDIEC